jgi:hypothetical protein
LIEDVLADFQETVQSRSRRDAVARDKAEERADAFEDRFSLRPYLAELLPGGGSMRGDAGWSMGSERPLQYHVELVGGILGQHFRSFHSDNIATKLAKP